MSFALDCTLRHRHCTAYNSIPALVLRWQLTHCAHALGNNWSCRCSTALRHITRQVWHGSIYLAEIRKARPSRLKVLILQSPAIHCTALLIIWRALHAIVIKMGFYYYKSIVSVPHYRRRCCPVPVCDDFRMSRRPWSRRRNLIVCGYICNNICLHNSTAMMMMIIMIRLSRIKYSQQLCRMVWSNSEALCSALTRSTSQSSCFISLIATI